MSQDLEDLQLRYTELARTAEELSDIVANQALRIERLESSLKTLREQFNSLDPALTGEVEIGDERPPHY
ncbi:MAG: SlyX family protein [Pseudomonadota bacterium]